MAGPHQALYGAARRQVLVKIRQRTWVLGLMFCAPLLFMLSATSKLSASAWASLHPHPHDFHFAAAFGEEPTPRSQRGFSLGGPHVYDSSSSRDGSRDGSSAAEGSGASSSSEGSAGQHRRTAMRRLISSDDSQQAVQQVGSSSGGTTSLHHPRQQQRVVAVGGQPRVWLYTLLGADYEGTSELLPHWLAHYLHTLGFVRERLLVVVNHNSSRPEAGAELAQVQAVLANWGVPHTLWTGRYSSDAHLKVKLQLLAEKVADVEDWIVIADSDEFHTYTEERWTISQMLQAAEQRGSNWVLGQMVDRVSHSGELAPVQAEPSLFQQFPYNCHVVRHVSRGSVWKVVAAKAYWRTNTGNHYVVGADRARMYFGGADPGVKNPRGGWFGADDLWPFTPYEKNCHRYQYSEQPEDPGLWQLSQYPTIMPVFHFKWHHGVLQSAADRYEYYSGNVTQPGGLPRYKHYNESRNILEALSEGRIDLQAAHCTSSETLPVLLQPTRVVH